MDLSVENYEKVIEFLYELSSGPSFSPVKLVKHIARKFNWKNVGFVSYVDLYPLSAPYDGSNIFRRPEHDPRNFKELALEYQEVSNELDYLKKYYYKYYREDFMDPYNLPYEFRGRNVLRSEEIPKHFYINTDYYKYLRSLGFSYFMSAYLYKNTKCIGRIGLHRTEEQGDFKGDDVRILEIIGKHISKKLEIAIDYNKILHNYKLLETTVNNINSGVVILDSKFNLLSANMAANQFSAEIIESKNFYLLDDIHIGGSDPLELLCKHIINDYLNQTHTSYQEFNTIDSSYCCNLTPMVLSEGMSESIAYNLIFINRHTKHKDQSLFQIVNKFSLTPREVEVLDFIQKGYNNKQIASTMVLSIHTVKKHVSNIYEKVGVGDRLTLMTKLNKITKNH